MRGKVKGGGASGCAHGHDGVVGLDAAARRIHDHEQHAVCLERTDVRRRGLESVDVGDLEQSGAVTHDHTCHLGHHGAGIDLHEFLGVVGEEG